MNYSEKALVKSFMIAATVMALVGCATGRCLQTNSDTTAGTSASSAAGTTAAAGALTSTPTKAPGKETVKPESKLDRVKVFKADGSLQCGQGKAIPAADMQKDLGDIKVYSSANKNDGMMRIQVCGSPTGNANVYEIDRKNLEAALKKGFKEWTFDN